MLAAVGMSGAPRGFSALLACWACGQHFLLSHFVCKELLAFLVGFVFWWYHRAALIEALVIMVVEKTSLSLVILILQAFMIKHAVHLRWVMVRTNIMLCANKHCAWQRTDSPYRAEQTDEEHPHLGNVNFSRARGLVRVVLSREAAREPT